MDAAPTYGDFYRAVLEHLDIAPTVGNLRTFGVITLIEGRNDYWNPMNWTLPATYPRLPGNTAGVRMFPDAATGARQTATQLTVNSRWLPFVASLRDAKTRIGPLNALAKIYAQWGSFPKFLIISAVQAASVLHETMPTP